LLTPREGATLNCPRCETLLKLEKYKGIEVDRCPDCKGLWLDHPELDQLEDTVMDDDDLKGTMEYARRASEISCPKCGVLMTTFNYRAYNLPIDYCPEEHGFWLDKGEEERVLELIKQRTNDLNRSSNAEVEWAKFLGRVRSGSFFDKVKNLFKG
jgi:Zn-finger nucleic acid-binding protein